MTTIHDIIRKCNFDSPQFYDALFNWLEGTEQILRSAVRKVDNNATARITPSIDIGLPDDVRRISGGFLTGCFVEWSCNTPFVPVDTTVGVCTSSVYRFSDKLNDYTINDFEKRIKKIMSLENEYIWNFNLGNHFIILGEDDCSSYLIMHSSASEFKKQLDNGLYPMPNNWYWDSLNTLVENNRYLRFIKGKNAELFWKIASSIPEYNTNRHNYFAENFAQGLTKIEDSNIEHHYGMPSQESINIGCFVAKSEKILPIFSALGQNIFLYEVNKNDPQVGDVKLIPHGWGKTYPNLSQIQFINSMQEIQIANNIYSINSDERIKGDIRMFCDNPNSPDFYFNVMSDYYKGNVIKTIKQRFSHSKHGNINWINNTD
ncbi:hypothetical protein D0T84_11090 [Dysgonomonas sp. 521]|uniref:hypothetical protein n=1 Tax=Dysgonomonas sp. 521 TaxID=2302932 RepID=UPI0013D38AA6|nr:hypothetical protein [Dysgonomonas sp. 521]NDV95455.1 hypothetical protein [Dysgonomonas sp. 521]